MRFFFGCAHKKTSFPITLRAGDRADAEPPTYIVCLDCGKEIPYSWDEMRVTRPGQANRHSAATTVTK